MPVFHSVGASDAIEPSDLKQRVDDGLPNTLEEWIRRDGLIRFKIKLNGGNLPVDLDRVVRIDRVVSRVLPSRGVRDWKYLLDFNEGCPNVAYLLEFMRKVREATPDGVRAHPLHRAADRRAICRRTAPTSCTKPPSCARSWQTRR